MKVPINEKYLITITEAAMYFSMGRKKLYNFAAEHPDLAFHCGNRWLFYRERMEQYLAIYRLGPGPGTKKVDLDIDSDENELYEWDGCF